mgnify:CR=1 FL=1
MKRHRIIFLLIFIFLLAGCAQADSRLTDNDFVNEIIARYPELNHKPYEIETVSRVVDGDTFETASGLKVRLIGVNTPEVYGGAEHYGREASAFSKEQLQNKTVYLFQDVSETDRYGRLLRYVFIEDQSVMFNEYLLIEGYANTMTVPPDVMFADKFADLERQSRESGKGLWGDKDEKDTVLTCEDPKIKGNVNSKGEKIYHVPGGRSYEQTKAEQMFCTEEDAIKAGFRKAMY